MHRYWQSETRYYGAEVMQDMFGDWLFIRRWGGLYNARGQTKTILVQSYENGIELIEDLAKTRLKRGYAEIHCPTPPPMN